MNESNSLLDEFIVESKEHLASIQEDFLEFEKHLDQLDPDMVNRIFRAIHTVKGTSGFFGLRNISDLSHAMETTLSAIRSGEFKPDHACIDKLLLGLDTLNFLLDDAANSDNESVSDVIEKVDSCMNPTLDGDASNLDRTDKSRKKLECDFPLRNSAIESIPGYHEFLYILNYDLSAFEKETGINPMSLIKNLSDLGEIIDGVLESDPNTPAAITYKVLYSTILDPEVIDTAAGIPIEKITQLNKKEICSYAAEEDTEEAIEIEINDDIAKDLAIASKKSINVADSISDTISKADVSANCEADIEIAQNHPAKRQESQSLSSATIRIRLDVLDKLMMLAGELVLVRNQQLLHVNRNDPVSRSISQRLDIVTSDLQEMIMRTRMQPIGNIFSKFNRIVRDLGKSLNKQIDIEMYGNDVELDKTILETLTDPLTHIVRNSCDHGIENPDDRILAGKPAMGRIYLNAFHEGGQMNIEIADDGKGIDVEAVRAKAVNKGLKTEEELSRMSEKDILSLIFLPGFSTAQQVSELSGRGVGMDVVRTSIEKLGGIIDINSKPGKGTKILLRLPLTLAIIPSLIVVSEGRRYAVPQVNLEELVCLYDNQIREKIEYAGSNEVYRLRNSLLPIAHLKEALHKQERLTESDRAEITEKYRQARASIRAGQSSSMNFAVLKAGDGRYGLVIDSVIGTEEIVVKPMHRALKGLPIYSGATVLGDGKVALILDVLGIARHIGIDLDNQEDRVSAKRLESKGVSIDSGEDLLLFRSGAEEQFAMKLSDIKRVERIDPNNIENVGDKEFITIEGKSCSILKLCDYLKISPIEYKEEMFLIIPKIGDKNCGILISGLVDIGNYSLDLDADSYTESGIDGSGIIDGKMTLLINSADFLNLPLKQKLGA
jgi:two-component system chemotaxis sensor kinase CheA